MENVFLLYVVFDIACFGQQLKKCSLRWKLGEKRILAIREVAYSSEGPDTLFISRRKRTLRSSVKI